MTDIQTTVLELSHIHKRFGSVKALLGVSMTLTAGEVVALVGDNGAGKSTLIKVIAGVISPDDGIIRVKGQAGHFRTPREASQAGIETVYQDLALAENLDTVANLFLGHELTRGPNLDEENMEEQARSVLARLGARIPNLRAPVASLSGGQRQAIAIARSMIRQPTLVQLDEPTAALGVTQTHQVLELIGRLRAEGISVLVISHNLADVFAVADRIVVLRLGRHVVTFRKSEVDSSQVVAAITGVYRGEEDGDDALVQGNGKRSSSSIPHTPIEEAAEQ